MDSRSIETDLGVQGAMLPATVTLPEDRPPAGGIVALHGAAAPERHFFLYPHLAEVAGEQGWAVLRYDRRPWGRGTIPFQVQAADALAAVGRLADVDEMLNLRATLESFLRGETDREAAQAHIDRSRDRPWFDLAYVPAELPPLEEVGFPGLFDFDPTEPLRRLRRPLLAIWGTEDDEVPPGESLEVVRRTRADATAAAELHLLDGVGHTLTRDDRYDASLLDPRYDALLRAWLQQNASPTGTADDHP